MINQKKIVVVMPAYNAAKTLAASLKEIDRSIVDEVILVDDYSQDGTFELAHALGIKAIRHERNLGYGGNQKTCYKAALEAGADIVIMLHPDYQYTPKLLPVAAHMLASGLYDVALGSRILSGGALKGGMPLHKYVTNRILTCLQNICTGQKLSEYHTGYRAFTRQVLEKLPLDRNDDDFIFDNQMLLQAIFSGFRIGEFTCPTLYFPEASSINFRRGMEYSFGCLWTSALFVAAKYGLHQAPLFRDMPRRA